MNLEMASLDVGTFRWRTQAGWLGLTAEDIVTYSTRWHEATCHVGWRYQHGMEMP